MSNIAYFEVPADDLKRAKKFYTEILGWEFNPSQVPNIPVEYWNISTGKSAKDTLNMGGLYQRKEQSSRILMYAVVDDIDTALQKVEKLGGKILSPKMSLDTVGNLVTVIDSEGNLIGLWEREKHAAYPHSR
ncbi:MAG TPA: VOC family protein [Methanoregulaceae archaeon]|nr:VOC family protein [Methanoregulaceae archaeon]MDD5684964.1 VOC family protein [Methanoregulaceae archaeon]HOP67810.1 VOC family protein [Methanoregulaceae archaeon]HPQ75858.1 VOC family protein [Methanoregulaceae archaeon]HQA81413.1 VOC family protein [Methanoregulaceae archaeon]